MAISYRVSNALSIAKRHTLLFVLISESDSTRDIRVLWIFQYPQSHIAFCNETRIVEADSSIESF